jgi:uncharacterized hydrophobic protein (TIGR00271 family)
MTITRPSVQPADIERMADKVLLSYGPTSAAKYSAFWVLLILAGVIATAGVAADSTATVIGAMIVAPLMTPILGTAFALVLSEHKRMLHSALVVVAGAAVVVVIGFLFGLLDPLDADLVDNSQVAARVNPALIDLVAALATGTVGAFALARADISDTLPGVAIAISLVPPLAVVGLTLEAGQYENATGALLLFLTNVTAIMFTATLVLMLFQVRDVAHSAGYPVGRLTGITLAVVVALVVLVAIPLAYSSAQISRNNWIRFQAAGIVSGWTEQTKWRVVRYEVNNSVISVVALGPPPQIDPQQLRDDLDEAGFADVDLELSLVVGGERTYPGVDSS